MGTFLKGVVAGVVGLGVLAWLVTAYGEDKDNNASEETEN